jgi:hypothetical protein
MILEFCVVAFRIKVKGFEKVMKERSHSKSIEKAHSSCFECCHEKIAALRSVIFKKHFEHEMRFLVSTFF